MPLATKARFRGNTHTPIHPLDLERTLGLDLLTWGVAAGPGVSPAAAAVVGRRRAATPGASVVVVAKNRQIVTNSFLKPHRETHSLSRRPLLLYLSYLLQNAGELVNDQKGDLKCVGGL